MGSGNKKEWQLPDGDVGIIRVPWIGMTLKYRSKLGQQPLLKSSAWKVGEGKEQSGKRWGWKLLSDSVRLIHIQSIYKLLPPIIKITAAAAAVTIRRVILFCARHCTKSVISMTSKKTAVPSALTWLPSGPLPFGDVLPLPGCPWCSSKQIAPE